MIVTSRIITEIIGVADVQFAEVLNYLIIEMKRMFPTNPENKSTKQTRRENGLAIHI